MELYQKKWCISGSELIQGPDNPDGIMTMVTYKHLQSRKQIHILRRGCRNTPAMIEFASLPPKYRQQHLDQLGYDPRQDVEAENPIAKSLVPDEKARHYFFHEFRCPDGKKLSAGAAEEYSANADLLNTLHAMANTIRGERPSLGNNVRGLWDTLAGDLRLIDKSRFPHSLPTNAVRLRERLTRYLKEGPASLIHRGYGNRIAEKLTEESRRWLLARWSNPVEKATSVEHLFELYNMEAVKRDWKPLKSVSTIRNYLYDPEVVHLWEGSRYGYLVSKQKHSLQLSTTLPTLRDSLWYSDGTKLNFLYRNEDGKTETSSVYEIMDAYSEVFLGYHISKTEDNIAQYNAYKMAIQFAGCKPYQISYDNQGGHKKLEAGDFLKRLARLAIRTQPYNGRSKTIESAFGRFQSRIMKEHWFFTGQNITARAPESQMQKELIAANKKKLPSLEEVKRIYLEDRQKWNLAPHPKTGIPRIEMYRSSKNPRTRPLEQWEYVNLFWITRPEPVTMTGYGISITENKEKHDYLVYQDNGKPDFHWHRENVDRKFHIMYDPQDLDLIYLCLKDHKGELCFVKEARTKITVARGKQEQTSDDLYWIKMFEEANKIELIRELEAATEVQREFGMTPEDYGLISPGIPGITKRARTGNVGRIDKAISNLTAIDDDEEIDLYKVM